MLSFKKNVLSNVCLGFFGTDAILAHVKAWHMWKCPRRSRNQQNNAIEMVVFAISFV